MSQHITAIGQIATDPKLFTPESGVPFCTFRLACTERRFDGKTNEWIDGVTNWFTVNAFRSLAVHAKESFAKGDRLIVGGRLRVRRWEKDEKAGNSVEIDADGIGHDVRWGVSSFEKRTASGEGGDGSGEGADAPSEVAKAREPVPGPGANAAGSAWLSSPDSASEEQGERGADGFTPREAAAA